MRSMKSEAPGHIYVLRFTFYVSVSQFERPHAPQAKAQREPADRKGQRRERAETNKRPRERPGFRPRPGRRQRQEHDRAQDVQEAEHQAERPAETAHDLARVLFLE